MPEPFIPRRHYKIVLTAYVSATEHEMLEYFGDDFDSAAERISFIENLDETMRDRCSTIDELHEIMVESPFEVDHDNIEVSLVSSKDIPK